jgi:hypothetical protein
MQFFSFILCEPANGKQLWFCYNGEVRGSGGRGADDVCLWWPWRFHHRLLLSEQLDPRVISHLCLAASSTPSLLPAPDFLVATTPMLYPPSSRCRGGGGKFANTLVRH